MALRMLLALSLLGAAQAQEPVWLIGVGGGETGRIANALARDGLAARIFGAGSVVRLPDRASDYQGVRTVILGPLPRGARSFAPRQLEALVAWVRDGGGLVLAGGMDCFTGADGRGGYGQSPLAEILPVILRERSDFATGAVVPVPTGQHELLAGLPTPWPELRERNRAVAKPGASTLVSAVGEPLLVAGTAGEGRVAALLTTWGWPAQRDFTLWPGFARLWCNLARWSGRVEAPHTPLDRPLRVGGGKTFAFARDARGCPTLVGPDGASDYGAGTSVEDRTLDYITRGRDWNQTLYHLWAADPLSCARAGEMARRAGARLALFVPQVGPYARFRDDSTSGTHIPYDAPWHRVPDFYNPTWQAAFRDGCAKLAEAVAPYRDQVAILWVTNEPEIYRGWDHWLGADFCLNTPATLAEATRFARERYGTTAALEEAWRTPDGHPYAFASWEHFGQTALDQLAADGADGRLSLPAHRWLLDFVTTRWLPDWHRTVRRILGETGLAGPALGVRHNYNSLPEFALLPWDDLDVCGKNLYAEAWSDAYVAETWDAFRASGLPVLMSEWGVQPAQPPLGYVGGDEITRAEQAVLGRALARRCPWVVGDLWSNVNDIDFPWAFLWPNGRPKPFVPLLAQAATVPRAERWSPVAPGAYTLSRGHYDAPGVSIDHSAGPADRSAAVRFQ
ncbi:MAG: hypothetical protein HZB16_12470 [Armatimonadetes bacterium]|nr:hypothetical protein [Armatimonadota bacterium]